MSPADVSARREALDINGSFAVAAPAGSGKTGLLTQRVLGLLAQVSYPEEILCLTFTRKAAGEMRQRILTALQDAVNNTDVASDYEAQTRQLALGALARDKQQGWQLLKSPNRLRVQTIDSCCRHLSTQLSRESGLSDNLEPAEVPSPLYLEAIREGLLTDLAQRGPAGDAIEAILQHLDNDLNKLERLLIALLQNRDQWLTHLLQTEDARSYLERFLCELINDSLALASQYLQDVGSDLAMLADYGASQLAGLGKESTLISCRGLAELPPTTIEGLRQWQALADLLLTTSDDWRKERGINIKLGFPTAKQDPEFGEARKQQFKEMLSWCRNHPELKDALLDIRYLPTPNYPDNQWRILASLAVLLPRIAARLSLVFQARGHCDFTEIASAALRALGDDDCPTDLALKLDYQLKHILVDEFQDTSSLQYELLRRLTRGWSPDDGRSLFIVGDGMQSLYGFRNANVGLFLQARQRGLGDIDLKPLDLTVNFRSQQGVIDWVNRVFKQAFPIHHNINRGAVSYAEATAFHPPCSENPVSVDIFADYPNPELGRQAEAKRIVELVENAKQRDPRGSIAILARNRSHLNAALKALEDSGHSWQARDIEPLSKQMAVIDLLSLTRALSCAGDRIAWLSVLRAPWCGLNLKDLYYLANHPADSGQHYPPLLSQLENAQLVSALSPEGKQILTRVAPLLLQAWQQRRRKSLRIAVEGLWVSLGGNSASENQYKLNSCIDFLNLIDKYDNAGEISDWRAFTLSVEQLYAAPKETGDPQLQVMTIHKAKGLEFDTVIIPGLNRSGASDSGDLLLWREGIAENGHAQLFIGPITETGAEQDPLYRHLKRERSLKSQLENARVFYVGTTRAIKQLHLTFCQDTGKAPANNTLLNCIWPWLESRLDNGDLGMTLKVHNGKQQESADSTEPAAGHTLKRLPISWQPEQAIFSPGAEPSMVSGSNEWGNTDSPQQRHTGTVMHQILQAMVEQHTLSQPFLSQGTPTSVIKSQEPFWRLQLKQLGVTDIPLALTYLKRAIDNLHNDRNNHWLFDPQLEASACELALGYFDAAGKARTAIVDRTFIYQNRRWIVDYKLAEPGAEESFDEFLAAQQDRYMPQLKHYAELFNAQEKRETVVALYFPLLPRLQTWII